MREETHNPENTPHGPYRQDAGLASAKKRKDLRLSGKRNYATVDCFKAGESGRRNCLFRFSSYMCSSAIRKS
jgi:hypothetical protein